MMHDNNVRHAIVLSFVFLVWSAVCVDWYVCSIKQECGFIQIVNAAQVEQELFDDGEPQPEDFLNRAKTSKSTVQKKQTSPDDLVRIEDNVIYFQTGFTSPMDSQKIQNYLSQVAQMMLHAGQKVVVEGHTDNQGALLTNQHLSLSRAKAIKDILVSKGVSGQMIQVHGYGPTRPKASNQTFQGRQLNRRVELRFE